MERQEPLLNCEQVAELLGCSAAWVRDHSTRRSPRIPVIKLGNNKKPMLRFRRRDVDEFIEKHWIAGS